MIAVVTRGSRFSKLISNFKKKEFKEFLFKNSQKTCLPCTRGYVILNNKNLFFKTIFNNKGKILLEQSKISIQRNFTAEEDLKSLNFEKMSTETLESLSEYFDELIEQAVHLQDADVSCGDGVLTVKFGKEYGTYVINRQVPNQQIWLSSPKSGPKRYDFIDGTWIYKHDGKSLHELLNEEIPNIVKFSVSFNNCVYGVREK